MTSSRLRLGQSTSRALCSITASIHISSGLPDDMKTRVRWSSSMGGFLPMVTLPLLASTSGSAPAEDRLAGDRV